MRTKKMILSAAAMAGLLAGMAHTPANAASVTVSGANVDFTYDDSLLGLYGTPTVSGDNLFFSPLQFRADSLNGTGMSSTPAASFIDIHAHDGYSFVSLSLTEFGYYKLLGSNSAVSVDGGLLAMDKNNPPAPGTHANAILSTQGDLGMHDGVMHSWTASTQLALTGSNWTDATTLRVTLDNLLGSYTSTSPCTRQGAFHPTHGRHSHETHGRHGRHEFDNDSASDGACGAQQQASIETNFVGLNLNMIDPPLSAVPLPPSLALFLPGLLSLLGFGARRKLR